MTLTFFYDLTLALPYSLEVILTTLCIFYNTVVYCHIWRYPIHSQISLHNLAFIVPEISTYSFKGEKMCVLSQMDPNLKPTNWMTLGKCFIIFEPTFSSLWNRKVLSSLSFRENIYKALLNTGIIMSLDSPYLNVEKYIIKLR